MKPYYEDGQVTIYHDDCRTILDALPVPDLLLTDPPYGIRAATNRATARRGNQKGLHSPGRANDFAPVAGDDEAFDPSHLLAFPRAVIFGGNHFADKLPASPSWIVWDKLDGLTSKRPVGFNDSADCELAWTNLGGPARLFSQRWMGLMVKGEENAQKRVHPTQKPVGLMRRIIEWRTQPGDLILDPYMGSGSILRAAADLGRRAIGVEIEEAYCAIAADRLSQGSLDVEAA